METEKEPEDSEDSLDFTLSPDTSATFEEAVKVMTFNSRKI